LKFNKWCSLSSLDYQNIYTSTQFFFYKQRPLYDWPFYRHRNNLKGQVAILHLPWLFVYIIIVCPRAFLTRNTAKMFAPPSARRNFFKCAPPNLKSWIRPWCLCVILIDLIQFCYVFDVYITIVTKSYKFN
jgi:hypothetical protein